VLVAADGYVSRVVARPDRDDRAARPSSLRGEIDRRRPATSSTRVLRSASYASPRTRHARARLPGLPLRVSFTADVLHPGALRYGLCSARHTRTTLPHIQIHIHIYIYYICIYIYVCIYNIYIYIRIIYIYAPPLGGSVLLDPPRRTRSPYGLRGPVDRPSRSRPPPPLLRRRPTEEGDPRSLRSCDPTLERRPASSSRVPPWTH